MGDTPGQHEMTQRATFPSGAQEWFCPTCRRHLIIGAVPDVQRLVLEEGDGNAVHTGRRGQVQITKAEVAGEPVRSVVETERAWRRWLGDNGIDWDGVA